MNKHRLARIISFAFHPIVFALLVPFLIVYKESASITYGLKWTFFSSFFLFLAGGLFFFLRPKSQIKDMDQDFDIAHKENRHIFYSICALISLMYFIISVIFKGVFFPLSNIALGMLLGIISFDIINYYVKISIHAAVVTAYILTFYFLYGLLPFLGVAWTLPVILWSRLYLKKHTKLELLTGVMMGASITLITIIIARVLKP